MFILFQQLQSNVLTVFLVCYYICLRSFNFIISVLELLSFAVVVVAAAIYTFTVFQLIQPFCCSSSLSVVSLSHFMVFAVSSSLCCSAGEEGIGGCGGELAAGGCAVGWRGWGRV